MYNPNTFRKIDCESLFAFIQTNPLGLFITNTQEGLLASSLPFLLYPNEGEKGILRAHFAMANPHWRALELGGECLIVFQGSQGYVSPSWYPSKAESHKVVPTWNYSMVQCRGIPKVIDDPLWLKKQISDLTDFHENKRPPQPWKVEDAPADFMNNQIKAIVGVEIFIDSIEGKFKMSQNRPREDRLGVMAGISNPEDPHYNPNMAELMKKLI